MHLSIVVILLGVSVAFGGGNLASSSIQQQTAPIARTTNIAVPIIRPHVKVFNIGLASRQQTQPQPVLEQQQEQEAPETPLVHLTAELSGLNEIPSIIGNGIGIFEGQLMHRDQMLPDAINWRVRYWNLTSPVTMMKMHIGQFFAIGAPVATLCTNQGGSNVQPCPNEGELSGTITNDDVLAAPEQDVKAGMLLQLGAAIMSHNAYVEVHTTQHPHGELRGQIKFQPLV